MRAGGGGRGFEGCELHAILCRTRRSRLVQQSSEERGAGERIRGKKKKKGKKEGKVNMYSGKDVKIAVGEWRTREWCVLYIYTCEAALYCRRLTSRPFRTI